MKTRAGRPEQHRWNACTAEHRGIGPKAHADDVGRDAGGVRG